MVYDATDPRRAKFFRAASQSSVFNPVTGEFDGSSSVSGDSEVTVTGHEINEIPAEKNRFELNLQAMVSSSSDMLSLGNDGHLFATDNSKNQPKNPIVLTAVFYEKINNYLGLANSGKLVAATFFAQLYAVVYQNDLPGPPASEGPMLNPRKPWKPFLPLIKENEQIKNYIEGIKDDIKSILKPQPTSPSPPDSPGPLPRSRPWYPWQKPEIKPKLPRPADWRNPSGPWVLPFEITIPIGPSPMNKPPLRPQGELQELFDEPFSR